MNKNTVRRELRDAKRAARQAEREFNEALAEAFNASPFIVANRACRLARRLCGAIKRRLHLDLHIRSHRRASFRAGLEVAL